MKGSVKMANKKDLSLNPPVKLSELSKINMLDFIEKKSPEEGKWFYNLMQDNKIKRKNNLTGEIIDAYDIPKVRKAFAEKYFPVLVERKKKKESQSFEDRLAALNK